MKKKKSIRKILMILLAGIFLICGGVVLTVKYKYIVNNNLNRTAINNYTAQSAAAGTPAAAPAVPANEENPESAEPREYICAPITVDFKELKKLNSEIIGWIYCEDTPINFPVVQAKDNDFYIDHGYDRRSNACGAAFADALNQPDFIDSNTIIYAHHLIDGSMFASLEKWMDQTYFDEHPTMWILTPERDYRVDLFSAYYIAATDEAYTIFQGPSPQLDDYLVRTWNHSAVTADVELDGQAKYVMLSTCAYVFTLSRSVLHGKMVPIDTAGGVLIDSAAIPAVG